MRENLVGGRCPSSGVGLDHFGHEVPNPHNPYHLSIETDLTIYPDRKKKHDYPSAVMRINIPETARTWLRH